MKLKIVMIQLIQFIVHKQYLQENINGPILGLLLEPVIFLALLLQHMTQQLIIKQTILYKMELIFISLRLMST